MADDQKGNQSWKLTPVPGVRNGTSPREGVKGILVQSEKKQFPEMLTLPAGTPAPLDTYDARRSYSTLLALLTKVKGVRVGSWGGDLIKALPYIPDVLSEEAHLVTATGESLGLASSSTYREICRAADAQGLHVCPPWLALYIACAYPSERKNELLMMAMEPLRDEHGALGIFSFKQESDRLTLGGNQGKLNFVWPVDTPFMFLVR